MLVASRLSSLTSFAEAIPSRERSAAMAAMVAVGGYLGGFALPLEVDVGLVVLGLGALAATLAAGRDVERGDRGVELALAAFVAAGLLATCASVDPMRSLRLSAAFVPGLLLFLVLARSLSSPDGTRVVAAVLSGVCVVVGALVAHALVAATDARPAVIVTAIGSPVLLVPNDATLLALVAPLSLALALVRGAPVVRALGAVALLASAAALVVLQSRVGLVTLFGGVAAVAVLARVRWGGAVVASLAGIVVVLDGARGFPLAAKFARVLDPRIALWGTGLTMWRDASLLGHGPRSFGLLYADYREMLSVPAWLPVDDRIVPWAHNLWIEATAEQGVVGLLALLALVACGVRAAWHRHRTSLGDARVLAAAVLASLLGFCAAATVELSFLRQWVVVLFCTLLGLSAARRGSS